MQKNIFILIMFVGIGGCARSIPADMTGHPRSLFESRCRGKLLDAFPDNTTANQTWETAAFEKPDSITFAPDHNSEVTDALFPDGIDVAVAWMTPDSVKAFVVDPDILVDPWAIEDPSRCPATEVQAEVEVIVTGAETWPTTWTVALFNGEVRWRGQTALPATDIVVDAVQSALQANHNRVADEVEGAWFTITEGSDVSFDYGISSNELSRSAGLDQGTASLVP